MPWSSRKAQRDYMKRYRQRLRKQRDEIFGVKCWICESNIRLCLHRKDGKRHNRDITELLKAIRNPKDWVRLCGKCHDGVHFCRGHLKLDWDKILSLLA